MKENRFRWEEEFQNTWDGQNGQEKRGHLRINRRTENVQRGVVRKLLLVVDMSESVEERDMLPSRKWHIKKHLLEFYRAFSESNPLSTMGMIVLSDGHAQLVASIISEEEVLIEALSHGEGKGRFSFEAAMDSSAAFFKEGASLKEIVLVISSFSFFGKYPSRSIEFLLGKGAKIHSIHMGGELEILRRISVDSGGLFGVVDAPEDLGTLLELLCVPLPYSSSSRVSMLRIGFPKSIEELSICACHLKPTKYGYICPFCSTKVCHLPGICPICEEVLSSSVHLLKALHWTDSAPLHEPQGKSECRGCSTEKLVMNTCSECKTNLCGECSHFIRQEINFCFFCAEKQEIPSP
ncbi:transcription initiation factor TFIIH subunit 2 [Nematocida sp. LUAm3]|nr:transcription initiation factor TFIIH subunit 2 [Nematocida sp. LUAm3]KAI5174861.1 transcription initiation factor TFIIH subunit 2 [Nematocida sp. LUAm2]KAI5177541.1 transcription initiation factor TFIIH subunit 2 [Nematocida sp. LUAm1]